MTYRFEQNYRVRYDECNLFGYVTPVAILRYLQDIAALDAVQTELIGTGYWVAKRTILKFHAAIPAKAEVVVATYPLGFSKVTALRGYDVFFKPEHQGETILAVKAQTLWVYLDAKGRPTRITPELLAIWVPPGTNLPIPPDEETWPVFPVEPQFVANAHVRFSDLDVMGHMNNAAYVELLDNVAWDALSNHKILPNPEAAILSPQFYDIEYVASAKPGDPLEIRSWFKPANSISGQTTPFIERLQQVHSGNNLLVRSRSSWKWQQAK